MKHRCRQIREILTHDGLAALQADTAAQDHLAECADCFAFLEVQAELDSGLAQLPSLDVSDPVVADLLRKVEAEARGWNATATPPQAGAPRFADRGKRLLRHVVKAGPQRRFLAAAAMVVLAIFLGRSVWDVRSTPEPASLVLEKAQALAPAKTTAPPSSAREDLDAVELETPEAALPAREVRDEDYERDERSLRPEGAIPAPSPTDPPVLGSGKGKRLSVSRKNSEVGGAPESKERQRRRNQEAGTRRLPQLQGGAFLLKSGSELLKKEKRELPESPAEDFAGREAGREFLDELERTDGLSFKDPSGYWANTYLPGDPLYRQLRARLLGAKAEGQQRFAEVRPTAQPFDPPGRGALAVYLHGSRRSLEGRQRMLVQVGLKATERRSGRRPPLSLALVLDVSAPLPAADASALRALVMALAEERSVEDRFYLLAAGLSGPVSGGLIVDPDSFRHGPLTVALDQIFGLRGSAVPGPSPEDTLRAAIRAVSEGSSDGPLGSSAVLFATARALGDATTSRLTRLARAGAVSGITVSTIGIGDATDHRELDRIALEGQGSQRFMATPAEAADLVDRELASVSRAVARALRLRIRLAPGVELVDVVGSYRLDSLQAEAAREAERSIDMHLARSLGIEADRGEDEDGIQIIIPAFFSGDAHVILLDVVASGPGAVADVTVRYKDLVTLSNGVTRDHLSLPRGRTTPGPLELNVFKNRLAYHLYQTLEMAGRQVESGDPAAARKSLEDLVQVLQGVRQEILGLAQDRDLASDIALLTRFVGQIGIQGRPPEEAPEELIDSLRLAARLKILPPPADGDN